MKHQVKITYEDGNTLSRDFLVLWIAEDAKKSLEDLALRYPGTIKKVELTSL